MADLKLCGKKVTNEQAKQIFTGMMGLIVVLVVVVISMSSGGGDGGGDAGDGAVPSGGSASYSRGGGSTAGRTAPVGTSQSGMIRITGLNNQQCLASGCTGEPSSSYLLSAAAHRCACSHTARASRTPGG